MTYKTAWRMGQQIRTLMGNADEFAMLKGHVEVDEAYVGGHRPGKRGRGAEGKTIVMGMKERGGPIVTKVIPNREEGDAPSKRYWRTLRRVQPSRRMN